MKKIIIASLFLALTLTGCSLKGQSAKKILSPEEAKAKAESFIKANLVSEGTNVAVNEITAEGTLYKLKVNVSSPQGSQDIESYISNDGESFFPQVINISDTEKNNQPEASAETATPAAEVATKTDKPVVELFVMSYCPYGTQMEKGIIPVVEALGDKIDFELKFCDYTMHGAQETDENLKDYCIQKEQPEKLLSYLNCFLKEGKSADCSKEAGLDSGKIDSCIKSTTKEYKIDNTTTDFPIYKTDNQKYGVSGSPTLVINGAQISTGRDSASLLKAVCSGFNNAPEECSKQLSSQTPSAGFGTGSDSSGNSAAGCAQ